MKFNLLKSELKKLNLDIDIKNSNELYIDVLKEDVRNIVNSVLFQYKLNFVSQFCREESGFIINIVLCSRKHGYYVIIRYRTESEIVSLQEVIYQAHLFEREMADLFGLSIIEGRDKRNIVKHEVWEKDIFPLRKEFIFGKKVNDKREIEEYQYKQLAGEGGYQISVGPVHAGIIEPGHFRFSVMGEPIENLEIRLMYKHKGIEKLCENIDANKLNLVFERVAGESSAAYSEAYALLIEKLTGCIVGEDIKALRVIMLELERIYNFLDDIAGICVDIGFSYPAKKYSFLSEQIHQLCERLTGSRFLRNSIIPCGNNVYFNTEKSKDVLETLKNVKKRFTEIVNTTMNTVSFLDRVENTGIVRNDKGIKLCMTGVVGRATGISYDVRHSFGYELYKELKKTVTTETIGGVFERYKLKIAEINDAFDFINKSIALIKKDILKEKKRIVLKENMEAVASVETVKGELVVYGCTDSDNKFKRIYFKTPSFTNWNGLTYAVLNEIVPDFPLCNKSFNMSYSENDR